MNSPVVVPVVPKTKGRGKKASTESVAIVDALPAGAEAVKEEKSKPKGRGKKVPIDLPVDADAIPVAAHAEKPRKTLIAKHALLHAFTLHLAQTSLQTGLFDQDLFDRFLASHSFFLDIPSLSNLFDNLDLKNLLKNAKIASKTHEKASNTKEKKKRVKKASKNEEPSDLISSLVSLASSKEPVDPPASPENTMNAVEEPGSPVKQKRKYSRKPKVTSITEELTAAADNE